MKKGILISIVLGILVLGGVLVWVVKPKGEKKVITERERITTEDIRANQPSISDNLFQEGGEPRMKLSGKKILMVIAPQNFRDEEFLEPKEVFESKGEEVMVISKGVTEATGTLGATVSVDKDISAVSAADFDAVVFVGGPGSSIYFTDSDAQRLAREASEQGKVLGAICIAPSILANAGFLEGKKATVFSSEAENLKAKGANYTGEDVTRDGKIVTASGPQAATAFGEKIAEALGE